MSLTELITTNRLPIIRPLFTRLSDKFVYKTHVDRGRLVIDNVCKRQHALYWMNGRHRVIFHRQYNCTVSTMCMCVFFFVFARDSAEIRLNDVSLTHWIQRSIWFWIFVFIFGVACVRSVLWCDRCAASNVFRVWELVTRWYWFQPTFCVCVCVWLSIVVVVILR